MLPKRFWKTDSDRTSLFRRVRFRRVRFRRVQFRRVRIQGKHFSTISCLNRVLRPLKSASPGYALGTVRSVFRHLRLGGVVCYIVTIIM